MMPDRKPPLEYETPESLRTRSVRQWENIPTLDYADFTRPRRRLRWWHLVLAAVAMILAHAFWIGR